MGQIHSLRDDACRAIIQNVINAAKENKKKEPNKEEPKSKLGVYRPGSWMSRAKKKEEFKVGVRFLQTL